MEAETAVREEGEKKKKTRGRQKIEIKKVESKRARYVHFSKRRVSLFRKASQLSIICGADVALAARSCGGKIFTFGDLNGVAARYLDHIDGQAAADQEEADDVDGGGAIPQQGGRCGGFWWENIDVEGKSVEELTELASMLALEKEGLVRRVTELIFPTGDDAAMAD